MAKGFLNILCYKLIFKQQFYIGVENYWISWANQNTDKSQPLYPFVIIFKGVPLPYFCVLQNFSCVFALLFLLRGFFILCLSKMFQNPFKRNL